MGNPIGIAFIVVFVAQSIGTVAYLVQVSRLMRRLEAHHPEIHNSLGKPRLVANNTPQNNKQLLGWLWRREYQPIADAATVSLARSVRTIFLCLAVGFVNVLLLFLLLQVQHGRLTGTP